MTPDATAEEDSAAVGPSSAPPAACQMSNTTSRVVRCLRWALAVAFACLCAGDLLPGVAQAGASLPGVPSWPAQQALLLSALCALAAALGISAPHANNNSSGPATGSSERGSSSVPVLAAAHLLSLSLAAAVALSSSSSSTAASFCPISSRAISSECSETALALLDAVGTYSARLARLDLGLCLLPTGKESPWLLVLGGGRAGRALMDYGGAMPLHRAAGWWCASMSALHSAAYAAFYALLPRGDNRLWASLLPVPLPGGEVNRLGLVNGFGVLGALAAAALSLGALPAARRRAYHVFQRLHLPLAWLLVACCALHDREVLLFALPGIASWHHARLLRRPPRRASGRARLLLPGDPSAVHLTINCSAINCTTTSSTSTTSRAGLQLGGEPARNGGRGQWLLVRAPGALGREWHPFSVAGLRHHHHHSNNSGGGGDDGGGALAELSVVVSARHQGDWSRALAALAVDAERQQGDEPPAAAAAAGALLEVEVQGPFDACGDWSLLDESGCQQQKDDLLLMIAGGTGIAGWLPGLRAHHDQGSAVRYRLLWCVQTHADYLALCEWLPPRGRGGEVIVYITRGGPAGDDGVELHQSSQHHQQSSNREHRACICDDDDQPAADTAATAAPRGGHAMCRAAQHGVGAAAAVPPTLAALGGLAMGFWSIHHMQLHVEGGGWAGLARYAAVSRCLPLLTMLATVAITASLAHRVMTALPLIWLPNRKAASGDNDLEAVPLLFAGGSACPEGWLTSAPPSQELLPGETSGIGVHGAASHDIRRGRPDLVSVIAESVAVAQRKGNSLTVVACGPAGLVSGAKAAARSQIRAFRQGGHPLVKFVGEDPAW